MKKGIEEIYRSLLANSNIEPPEHIWDSISQNLDIDSIWTNISDDLALQPFKRIENLSLLMSAGLFVLASILYSGPKTGSVISSQNLPGDIDSEEVALAQDVIDSAEIKNIPMVDPAGLEAVGTKKPDDEQNSNVYISSSIEESYDWNSQSNNFYSEEESVINHIKYYDPRKPDLIILKDPEPFSYLQWNTREVPAFRKNKFNLKLNYLGVTGSIKNTWIINYKTISGFSSDELHSTIPIFGREFGIFFGSRINQRTEIMLEYYFTSNYAQAYNEYVSGHYVTTGFNVDYHKINLIAGYSVKTRENSNRSFDLLFGPSMGILNKAVETVDQDDLYLTENYKRYVFGITGGVQYHYQLNRNFDLLTGMRLAYGLTNIYKGTPIIPASFRITHPAAISLSLGLRCKIE